jgi:hypothetical protein
MIEVEAAFAECSKRAGWHQTNYIQPHEYVLQHEQPELFAHASGLLAADSYGAMFRGYPYRYIDRNGWKYWIIDDVLNRERLPPSGEPVDA